VAIVLSVEDEDNQHNSDDIIYTAPCVQNHIVNQHQLQNPVIPYGNQALKVSTSKMFKVFLKDGGYIHSSTWFIFLMTQEILQSQNFH
jgi:hypothetical protein